MKVIFKTGVMSAGKTADLLSNEFNFRKKKIGRASCRERV